MRKRWTLLPFSESDVNFLVQELKINPVFCQLLVQRGIQTFADAKNFFRPSLAHLHDPFLMKDMEAAVDRLQQALNANEKILLYGDYDVDGTTSIALLYSFLKSRHKFLDYYIPDRYKEGYGVSNEGVDYARQNGHTLIIAMDCGIQAREQVKLAKTYGIDFIICDHHLPEGILPDASAILDPKRMDCNYPYKELSGCGVTFKFAQAFLQKNNKEESELEELLDLLVLSIASDIVPMTGENRVLAYFGLQKLNITERPGLKALIEESARPRPLSINDIVFGLGPHINAAGRLADAHQAVKLLLSTDKFVAIDGAKTLGHRNQLRKEFDKSIGEEARSAFEAIPDWENQKSIVLFNPKWHKGVIGIVASRMVEYFYRPTILLTESNGMAVGSARSVSGFNIHEAIKTCRDLLEKFGGHDHAAGLSLRIELVPAFKQRFEEVVQETLSKKYQTPEIKIAAQLDIKDINSSFWRVLKQFAPFGPGNRNPVFATKNVRDTGQSRLLNGNHLQLSIMQTDRIPLKGIAFDQGEAFAKIKTGNLFHVAYTLEEDSWKGKTRIRMNVKDIWV